MLNMEDIASMLNKQGNRARQAARVLATTSTVLRNQALAAMASALRHQTTAILAANHEDMESVRQKGMLP